MIALAPSALLVFAIASVVIASQHGWWVCLGCAVGGVLIALRDRLLARRLP